MALLKARTSHPAFHPNGEQQVIVGNPALFCLLRKSPDEQEQVLCLHNVSARPQVFEADLSGSLSGGKLHDLVSGQPMARQAGLLRLQLAPYEVHWLAG